MIVRASTYVDSLVFFYTSCFALLYVVSTYCFYMLIFNCFCFHVCCYMFAVVCIGFNFVLLPICLSFVCGFVFVVLLLDFV